MQYCKEDIIDALETVVETGVPSSVAAKILDVGTEDYLQYFENEVLNGVIKQGSTCCFIEGAYGSGKTHLLQLLKDTAVSNNLLVAEIELSKNTDFSHWNSVTKVILEKIQLKTETGTIQSVPRILDYLSEKLELSDQSLKQHSLPHGGFVRAIEKYLKNNQSMSTFGKEKLASYLLGQRIGATSLKKQNIYGIKNPLSLRNAELVFKTVFSSLFHLGYPVLILFDELDQTFQNVMRTSNKAQIAANLIRRLIDACSFSNMQGICMVFAVSQNFIPRCAEVYPALGERLLLSSQGRESPGWRSPVIRLENLNSFKTHDQFAKATIDKFISLAGELGMQGINKDEFKTVAKDVLFHNAGLDFRRPLIRRLSSKLLEKL